MTDVFNKGGFIPRGQVFVAPVGTRFLTSDYWTQIGEVESVTGDDNQLPPVTFTTPSRTITATFAPPRTRREKRDRNAFIRLIFGGHPPMPRRQLIHKGGKP